MTNKIAVFDAHTAGMPELFRCFDHIIFVQNRLECRGEIHGILRFFLTIVIFINRDQTHTHERQNALRQLAYIQIIPTEPGEILDHNAANRALPHQCQKLLKGFTLRVDAALSVVRKMQNLCALQIRLCMDAALHDRKLVLDAVRKINRCSCITSHFHGAPPSLSYNVMCFRSRT